jgi:predicted dehydrogenase
MLDVTPHPPLDTEIAHFVRCVRTGETPLVNGRVGLEALRVAQLVREKIAG